MVEGWTNLSVLIAGCGSAGKRHARVLHSLGVRDIRACDPVPAQREALAEETPVRLYESYENGLASHPDAVFICTPPKMHIPMALAAIEQGAHVFSEKPLSYSTGGIDQLADAAERSRRIVMTGLCFRYHDGLRRARELLDSGRFGRLVAVRCLMGENFPSVRPDYRSLFSAKYSGAFDLTHEIDLAVWFTGQPVRNVLCLAGCFSDIGIEAPDTAEILVRFEGNRIANIHLDFFQIPRRRQTELICSEGVITVEFASWNSCTVSSCQRGGDWNDTSFATQRDDMFRDEDRAFLRSVIGVAQPECGIDQARTSVEIIELARKVAGVDVLEPAIL